MYLPLLSFTKVISNTLFLLASVPIYATILSAPTNLYFISFPFDVKVVEPSLYSNLLSVLGFDPFSGLPFWTVTIGFEELSLSKDNLKSVSSYFIIPKLCLSLMSVIFVLPPFVPSKSFT